MTPVLFLVLLVLGVMAGVGWSAQNPGFIDDDSGTDAAVFLFVAFVVATCAALLQCNTAKGGEGEAPATQRVLVLARALYDEDNAVADRDDYAMIAVLRHRMTLPAHRDKDIAGMAQAYCAIYTRPRRGLVHTPRQLNILGRTDLSASLLRLSARALRGDVLWDPCGGRATQWAAPGFPSPLPVVDCGNTGNRFYGAPR